MEKDMNPITKANNILKKSKNLLDGFFSLKINIKNSFPLNFEEQYGDECGECIEEYEGKIFYSGRNDEKEIVAGKFSFGILNVVRAMNREFSAMDTFDVGGEPFEFYQVLYEYDTYDFNDFLEDAVGDEYVDSNGAYISSIEILPQYRGYGVGRLVLRSIIGFLEGKVGMVVMKSFPLQHQPFIIEARADEENKVWYEKMGYYSPELNQNYKSAQKKLNDLYTSYGFSKIKLPDDWMNKDEHYFGINMAYHSKILM